MKKIEFAKCYIEYEVEKDKGLTVEIVDYVKVKLYGGVYNDLVAWVASYDKKWIQRELIQLVKKLNYYESFNGDESKKYKVKDIKKLIGIE